MGEINDFMYAYLSLPKYHADFWNGTVFKGKRKIKVWQLEQWGKTYYKKRYKRKQHKDVPKEVHMHCRGNKDIILAVKVAEHVEDRLPFKRPERPIPTTSVVLYCGEGSYKDMLEVKDVLRRRDGEKQLHQMLLLRRVRIYDLQDLNEANYGTSFREIVGAYKRRDDKEELLTYYLENQEQFHQMDEISVELLGALLEMNKLKSFPQEKGGVNMCKAFEQVMEEGRQEGRREGSFRALCCLVEKGKLKLKDAASEVGMSEEMFIESMKIALKG